MVGLAETIENNKLIAEFMEINTSIPHDRQHIYLYDISWDWLMPVLYKIQNKGYTIEITYSFITTCRICYLGKSKYDKAINFYGDNIGGKEPITAIYKCVVKFLKYLENVKSN